jgi:hypothetical protein
MSVLFGLNILLLVYIATKSKCYKDPLSGNFRRGDTSVIVRLIMGIFGVGCYKWYQSLGYQFLGWRLPISYEIADIRVVNAW